MKFLIVKDLKKYQMLDIARKHLPINITINKVIG